MKKLASIFMVGMLALTACHSGNNSEQVDEEGMPTTSDSLRVALANQDSLLTLMNDVAEGMAQIKQMENILNSTSDLTAESQNRRKQIHDDMLAIQQTLQQRRERLDELEKKLKSSSYNNKTLRKSIETLKAQIAEQEGTIESLRQELANANIYIEKLTANVDSLNTTVANVTTAKETAEKEAASLNNELNTCYYALGSKSELKEHKLIESGFLRKTKILPQDFEQNYFTKADKRSFSVLDLHSTKAKVLTNQPTDSYQISEAPNGNKILKITNADRFWNTSNFLVIQID
jgi:uncharacterized coiled-coil protein SlyX